MTNLNEIAELISNSLPVARKGAPRLFGVWFGKPYDNWFTVVDCRVVDSHLVLYFDGGILLHAWSPQHITCNAQVFQICEAEKVRLEWPARYSPVPHETHFMELAKPGATVHTSPPEESLFSIFHPNPATPAFELL